MITEFDMLGIPKVDVRSVAAAAAKGLHEFLGLFSFEYFKFPLGVFVTLLGGL
jgi:hypothetical protein